MENEIIIKNAVDFIEDNITEVLNLKIIANECGYSEYHFSRLFKTYMKVSVMEYVTKRRLIKASEDIVNGERIIDIALKYGWMSHSGFTKAFKNEFGFYPSLLRAMLIELDNIGGSIMSHIFLNDTDEHATKDELFQHLVTCMNENKVDYNSEELEKVYQYACTVYNGVKRHSGDEYITHTLNVAIVLAQLNEEYSVICAGMFCDAYKRGVVALNEIEKNVPAKIYSLISKLSKLDVIDEDNIDEQVVVIKLAERLHNMRTIKYMKADQQKIKAQETIDLYLPLARKVGNVKLIDELNDLSIKFK